MIEHRSTPELWSYIASANRDELPVDVREASTIASHWQSPNNPGLTALSTGHPAWESMIPQIIAEAETELLTVRKRMVMGRRAALEKFMQCAELCALLVYLDSCPQQIL